MIFAKLFAKAKIDANNILIDEILRGVTWIKGIDRRLEAIYALRDENTHLAKRL